MIKDGDSPFLREHNQMPSYSSFDHHMILDVGLYQDI